MLNKNVMTFIGCDAEYNESEIVLFGAPFDSTTSYRPGARFGSQAIRNESYGLETYSPDHSGMPGDGHSDCGCLFRGRQRSTAYTAGG